MKPGGTVCHKHALAVAVVARLEGLAWCPGREANGRRFFGKPKGKP
jgi:hypothetical protein